MFLYPLGCLFEMTIQNLTGTSGIIHLQSSDYIIHLSCDNLDHVISLLLIRLLI